MASIGFSLCSFPFVVRQSESSFSSFLFCFYYHPQHKNLHLFPPLCVEVDLDSLFGLQIFYNLIPTSANCKIHKLPDANVSKTNKQANTPLKSGVFIQHKLISQSGTVYWVCPLLGLCFPLLSGILHSYGPVLP